MSVVELFQVRLKTSDKVVFYSISFKISLSSSFYEMFYIVEKWLTNDFEVVFNPDDIGPDLRGHLKSTPSSPIMRPLLTHCVFGEIKGKEEIKYTWLRIANK